MMKRVLSVLLSVVLLFGTVTFAAADEWGEYGIPSIYDSGSTEEYGTINMNRLPWWVGQEVPALFSARSAEDYRAWAQADGRWGSIPLGSSSATVASAGCLVTSVAKLMIQHGCQSASSFNVATLANWLNSNYGYMSDGGLYWNKPTQMVSGMSNTGDKYYAGNSSDYLETIKGYVNSNYGVLLNVNGGGHWVAVDGYKTKTTGSVYIMDSGSGMQNADVLLTSRYPTISRMHLYSFSNPPQPVSTAPGKPELWYPLNSDTYLEDCDIIYAWDDVENATYYNLSIYKLNETGKYECYESISYAKYGESVKLEVGKYAMQLQAVNGNSGEYTFGDLIYFQVLAANEISAVKKVTYDGHVYELYEVMADTTSAQNFALEKGGHLATISTAEENNQIYQLISSTIATDLPGALVGLSDIDNEGVFTWVTKEELVYSNWYPGQPDAYIMDEDYVIVYRDSGKWNDIARACPFVVEYDNGCGADGDNVTWKYDDVTGTLTISGTGEMKHYMTSSSKPWYSYRDDIKTVVIDDGVTSLGRFAFSDLNNVESVTIPDSVTSIGNSAFNNCSSLTSVTLPGTVTNIGGFAFANSGLTSLTIPASVTDIEGGAFGGCKNLQAIEVNENNTAYCDVDGVLLTKDQTVLHSFPGNYGQTQYEIPNTVTSVGKMAFSGCSLTSVTLPDCVTSVGAWAFSNCDGLTSVTIPDSVTSIDTCAFGSCDGLMSVTIGTGVTQITSYAFENCCSLTSLTIGNQVTLIARETFWGCDSLTDVYYMGTPEQKSNMTIGIMNGSLPSAQWHYMTWAYIANDNGTHTSVCTCSDCGETTEEKVDLCIDENSDAVCDLCEQRLVCYHDGNMNMRYTSNDDGKTHKVTINCTRCGEAIYTTQEAQNCTDADGFCTLCGQDLSCRHAQTETVTVYHDNGDRTHKAETIVCCTECGAEVSCETTDEAEGCIDENDDDVCDQCGADLYCDHSGGNTLVYTSNRDGVTHTVTLNCTVCEELIYDIATDEACTFSDGICTKCGGEEGLKYKIAGTSMVLGNELMLNIAVAAEDHTFEGMTAYVTHHAKDGDITYEYPRAFWVFSGGYFRFSAPVKAMQMTDQVSLEIRDAEGNVYNDPYSTSVRDYVGRVLPGKGSAYSKTLMVDMVNYGAAAQEYFGYQTDDLANAALTEEQKALATEAVTCGDDLVKGANYLGSTLNLKDRISLNVYFKDNGQVRADKMYAMVSFTGYKGNVENVKTRVFYNSNGLYVVVDQIVLGDSFEPVTVTVYNADGTIYGQVTDSVESYVGRNAKSSTLYMNIIKFAYSGRAYMLNK